MQSRTLPANAHIWRASILNDDFRAYVFYVNRPDLLKRSIEAFSEIQNCLTVVNNSGHHLGGTGTFHDIGGTVPMEMRPYIFTPPVPMTYAQSMNWMLKDARSYKKDIIIHFHSDAFSNNPSAIKQLLYEARERKGSKWGCLWTFYDILWAINPIAMQDIGGWDQELTAYFTDQDVLRRFDLAGWKCIDTGIQGINHEGSATINSDPELRFMNGITFPLRRKYYVAKWGGEPGQEIYRTPFNR
jgi:hypothetical protein